jgi:hypothetical protein
MLFTTRRSTKTSPLMKPCEQSCRVAGETPPHRCSIPCTWSCGCANIRGIRPCPHDERDDPRIRRNSTPECVPGRNYLLPVVGSLALTIPGKNISSGPTFIPLTCRPIELGFCARNSEVSPASERPRCGGVSAVVWSARGRRRVRRRPILFGRLRLECAYPFALY